MRLSNKENSMTVQEQIEELLEQIQNQTGILFSITDSQVDEEEITEAESVKIEKLIQLPIRGINQIPGGRQLQSNGEKD